MTTKTIHTIPLSFEFREVGEINKVDNNKPIVIRLENGYIEGLVCDVFDIDRVMYLRLMNGVEIPLCCMRGWAYKEEGKILL